MSEDIVEEQPEEVEEEEEEAEEGEGDEMAEEILEESDAQRESPPQKRRFYRAPRKSQTGLL